MEARASSANVVDSHADCHGGPGPPPGPLAAARGSGRGPGPGRAAAPRRPRLGGRHSEFDSERPEPEGPGQCRSGGVGFDGVDDLRGV